MGHNGVGHGTGCYSRFLPWPSEVPGSSHACTHRAGAEKEGTHAGKGQCKARPHGDWNQSTMPPLAAIASAPPGLSAKKPGQRRGRVGDSRICAGAEAGNAATLAGDLAKPHGMLRGSDAGGNGRTYGEERGALKRIHQEDSCNPRVEDWLAMAGLPLRKCGDLKDSGACCPATSFSRASERAAHKQRAAPAQVSSVSRRRMRARVTQKCL